LLHVTSLPSRHGIGDLDPALGPGSIGWLMLAQSSWQSLPLGPTGYGNSPYQPLSSFAVLAWMMERALNAGGMTARQSISAAICRHLSGI